MNKKLLSILAAFAALLGWVIWLGAAPPNPNVANFPGITVGVLSKVLTDSGAGLTYNGLPISGALTPWTSDINGGGFSLTNAASVVVGGSGASTFSGGVEVTTATAGAIAMFGSVNKDLTNATAAAIEAALGQVYQATNTVLTSWSAIPVTTAGVQALLGEVYQATNANLTALAGNANLYQATNTVLTSYSTIPTNSFLNVAGGTMSGNINATMAVGDTTWIDVSVTKPASRTNAVSGDMTFNYVTNGVDGADVTKVCWFFNNSGATKTLNFPVISSGANGWRTNVYGNMAAAVTITNATILKLVINCGGPTGSLALQTNVYASIEYYQ